MNRAEYFLKQWQHAQSSLATPESVDHHGREGEVAWVKVKPPATWLKINIDAAVFHN